MQCPDCGSSHIRKNGRNKGKQNHICVDCGRQFIDHYNPPKGYSEDIKRECLRMYVNGLGFRAIQRVKGVHHTTVIYWVKQVGELLPDAYAPEGHVLDKGSSTLDNPSKLIPIDKQSQHDIMHLNRFGKANRLACQSLDSGS
jgi:DNA-directed RNA polymerase subunit RPC12/RpoP